jgi:hypothetical protein
MQNSLTAPCALALCLLLSACGSAPTRVHTSQMRSTMGLDPKDVADVSAEMTESLLSANVLKNKGAEGRSIIAISNFRNNTALYDFDPGLIYNRVKVTLNKSGVAYSYVANDMYVNQFRAGVASSNARAQARNELLEFTGSGQRESMRSAGPAPQYSLTLELIEDHATLGRTTQKAYQIHMTLNQIGRGLAIWEDIRDVAKVGTRASVGF